MKKERIKKIDLNTCWFYYQPSNTYVTDLSLYFGDGKVGAPLIYNLKKECFELNINPFGNKKGIKLTNVEFAQDYSTLFLEATNENTSESFLLSANHKTDIAFFKFFELIYKKGFPQKLISPDDTEIHIGIKNGELVELCTIPFDREHKIIPLKGTKIKIQEYDSNGNPDSSENLLRKLPILSEKLVYIRNSKHYSIESINIENDCLISKTTEAVFEDIFNGIIIIKDFVKEVLRERLPFKSKC
jgi:ABC-type uncharacterized transport system, periplasmic component